MPLSTRLIAAASAAMTLLLCGPSAHARDLGTLGPTYPIAEPDLIEVMKAKSVAYERSPEYKLWKEEAVARATQAVTNPPALPGITTARAGRTYYYDPTYTLDRNILDHEGRLLFPAGTRKNPLEVVSLSNHLLFFDARDAQQVKRARELMAHFSGRVKAILVGGSPTELMKQWKLRVWYDQHGVLTQQLGIKAVPAIVSQEGMRLRIDELAP